MENLLDDIDGLVAPGLSTETPDWCVNCQSLRQELKQLKEEHCQNFGRLKQKIINTDLLIKKFKAKCDDFDLQCKRTEEANKRADKFQRQCEILEAQLKAALLDTEPLRKTKAALEEELNAKKTESQLLSDRLIATESAQKQYEHLAKSNSASVEALESEKKELTKKIRLLESGKVKKETAKEFKSEIMILKKENSSLKKDNSSLKKTEERLEKRLLLANKNIDDLNKSLKEKGMSPRIRRRASPIKSPFHSPRIVRYNSPTKSSVTNWHQSTVLGSFSSDVPSTQGDKKLDFDHESSSDDMDDDESVYSVAWTFSPITQCISPLPPSPACFVDQNDIDGDVSDIADELEQFLDHDEGNENSQDDNEEHEATLTVQRNENNEEPDDISMVECGVKEPDINETENIGVMEESQHVHTSEVSNNHQHNNNTEIDLPERNETLVNQENYQVKKSDIEHNDNNTEIKVSEMKNKSMEQEKCQESDNEQNDELKYVIVSERNEKLMVKENVKAKKSDKQNDINPEIKVSDSNEKLVQHQSKKSDPGVKVTDNSDNCRLSVKERIASAMEIVSPTSVKKASGLLKKREGNNYDIDSVRTFTRAPDVRRSARIRSKRDSEASEAESDSNVDKTIESKRDISESLAKSENTEKVGSSANCTEVVNEECVQDIIEDHTDNCSVLKEVDKSINSESDLLNKIKVDNFITSINTSQNVRMDEPLHSDPVKFKSNVNKFSRAEKLENNWDDEKGDGAIEMKAKTSEILASNEVEVWKEIQTEKVVAKPVPNRSCLSRQKAVTNKFGPTHLFEDLQAIREKRAGIKDSVAVKGKSMFGAHKFIPFQRSSAGTLSNEIENLNSVDDYELISREQNAHQDIQKAVLSSQVRKRFRRKMRKNCKYIDLDSEDYEHNKLGNNITPSSSNPTDDSNLELDSNKKSFDKDVLNITVENIDSVTNECVPSMKGDCKQSIKQNSDEKEISESVPNKLSSKCDTDNAAITDAKMNILGVSEVKNSDCAASINESNSLHISENNNVNDKILTSRQLSTGFCFKSVSFERASSTESGVSLRSSPAKLCMLETGSCDTIMEDVEENSNGCTDLIKDESDDKDVGEKDGNVIFGVEDIMDNEHESTCDTTENRPHSLLHNCDKYDTDTNTHGIENEAVRSDIHSIDSDIFASYQQPGCSGYNSELKQKGDDHLDVKLKDENSMHSDNVVEEFANDEDESSIASTASFGNLGRDSPMSDMFLSRFEFLNPVSPLPPSPVRELEDDVDDETCGAVVDEDGEFENIPVLGKIENSLNDNQEVCGSSIKSTTEEVYMLNKSETKAKALQKNFISSDKTSASPCDTVNDNIKIKSDSKLKTIPGTPEARHIKIEHLKMSPLPGMISPLKSPAMKRCQNKSVKGINRLERNTKIERSILNECDKMVKAKVDDTLVKTKSRASVGTTISGNSSVVFGTNITKKRKGALSKKSKYTIASETDVVPVRRSALVDKILRKRAEIINEKPNLSKDGEDACSTAVNTDTGKSENIEHTPDANTQNDIQPTIRTKNVNSDIRTHTTEALTKEDVSSTAIDTAKENKDRLGIQEVVVASVDEKGDQKVLEELPTGHDNLAFKRKTRVAHKPNMQSLKPQKIQIIDAPHLPPVVPGRKRRSIDGGDKVVQDKKPCKQSSFRRQKNESCVKKEDTRRMQGFLKSAELADKFVSMVTEVHGADCVGNMLLLSCLECIGRVMTDPLDVVYENCVTDSYRSIDADFPFLSDVEKRAVYLICHLLENNYIKKDELMRSAWDTVLCRNLSVNVIGKMAQCRLFIALCAVQGDVELARSMLYQLVTCTYINFILFIVPVVSVWPEVLRKNPADHPDLVVSHGLTLVLEELITERLLTMEDDLSKKVLLVLKKLCHWSGVCGNSEWVLKTLIIKLQTCTSEDSESDCAVFELKNALNLLCASKPWTWVKVNFIERNGLQSSANKYLAKFITKPISPKYMCAVLRVTSYVLAVHAATIRERDYQQIIRNWMSPVLNKKPSDDEVHLCCLETMIELTPLYPPCLEIIQKWFQEVKATASDELVARLEDLRSQYKQHFGLTCKPFTKS